MDINKLTEKLQEALAQAQVAAVRYGHVEVDGEHLLLALLQQPDGLLPRLLQRLEIPPATVEARVEQELAKRPKVGGPGADPGKVYVTQRLNQLFVKAGDEATRLKDDYISVEHILLAILDEGKSTPAGRILTDLGVTRDKFLGALTDVRGNQRVTSANPESTYEALATAA